MLIVDGFNVLHAAPRIHPDLQGLTLSGLVRLIQASRWSGAADGTLVVCDGSGGRSGIGDELLHPDAPVRVVFAGPGKDADSLIERLVQEQERLGKAGAAVIVSSDKQVLASAIGPLGAKPKRMTSEKFVRALVDDGVRADARSQRAPAAKTEPLDPEAVRQWLHAFGVGQTVKPAARPIQTGSQPAKPTSERPPPPDPMDGINPDDLDMEKWLRR